MDTLIQSVELLLTLSFNQCRWRKMRRNIAANNSKARLNRAFDEFTSLRLADVGVTFQNTKRKWFTTVRVNRNRKLFASRTSTTLERLTTAHFQPPEHGRADPNWHNFEHLSPRRRSHVLQIGGWLMSAPRPGQNQNTYWCASGKEGSKEREGGRGRRVLGRVWLLCTRSSLRLTCWSS